MVVIFRDNIVFLFFVCRWVSMNVYNNIKYGVSYYVN